MAETPRDEFVTARVTADEKADIEARAAEAQMTVSDFVRRAALATRFYPPQKVVSDGQK